MAALLAAGADVHAKDPVRVYDTRGWLTRVYASGTRAFDTHARLGQTTLLAARGRRHGLRLLAQSFGQGLCHSAHTHMVVVVNLKTFFGSLALMFSTPGPRLHGPARRSQGRARRRGGRAAGSGRQQGRAWQGAAKRAERAL